MFNQLQVMFCGAAMLPAMTPERGEPLCCPQEVLMGLDGHQIVKLLSCSGLSVTPVRLPIIIVAINGTGFGENAQGT